MSPIFKTLFCLLFSATLISATAQDNFKEGYVIMHTLDTIFGFVDFNGENKNAQMCKFRLVEQYEGRVFRPGDINGYGYNDGIVYVSKNFIISGEQKLVFAQLLFAGIYDIYFVRENRKLYYFIEDENGEFWELKNEKIQFTSGGKEYSKMSKEYVGTLKVLFSDYLEIQPEIERSERTPKSLISLTTKYHEYMCPGEDCFVYKEEKPQYIFSIAPIFGMSFNSLELSTGIFDFKSERSISPQLGIMMSTTIPHFNYRFSFEISSLIQTNWYASTISSEHLYIDHMDLYVKTLELNNAFNLKYTFSIRYLRPFVSAGGLIQMNLDQSAEHIHEIERETIVRTYETNEKVLPTVLLGYNFRAGIINEISPLKNTFLFVEYSSRNGNYVSEPNINAMSRFTSVSLTAGIFF